MSLSLSINDLIKEGESPRCDFKQVHQKNKANLIHDILSLANADVDSNRFLLFGVCDDGSISGLKNDENRRKLAEISNLMISIGLNHSPTLKLETLKVNDLEIDVLEIVNLPEKPYFLEKKYTHEGKILPAGTIYTRSADTNTPIDKTAEDIKVQKMFKERLGINKTPLECLKIYLRDFKNWEKIPDNKSRDIFYYKPFPEFTLVENKEIRKDFNEPWTQIFPAQPASMNEFLFKYHTTFLKKVHFVWCDDYRFVTVLPKKINISEDNDPILNDPILSYYIVTDSYEALANRVIQHHCQTTDSEMYISDVIKYFDTDDEAERILKKAYNLKNPNFIFYRFSNEEKKWVKTKKIKHT